MTLALLSVTACNSPDSGKPQVADVIKVMEVKSVIPPKSIIAVEFVFFRIEIPWVSLKPKPVEAEAPFNVINVESLK